MPRITIRNLSRSIEAGPNTILDSALTAGLPFPHGCRSGSCTSCECRLIDGEVDILPGLGAESSDGIKGADRVLACRARPRTDVTIEWLGTSEEAVPAVRNALARVLRIDGVGRDILRLRVDVEGADFPFLAGQYVELGVDHHRARAFSMANPPGEPTLEFLIRHLPHGAVSSYVAERLKVGDKVRLRGPYGNAYLRPGSLPMVAIAGGVGLAPIRSIVLDSLRQKPDRRVNLYLGARSERDICGLEEWSELTRRHVSLSVVPVLSEPDEPTSRRLGLVHEAVGSDFATMAGFCVHIAGPPPMVQAARTLAEARGADPDRIFTDPFLAHQPPGLVRRFLSRLQGPSGQHS